MNPTQEAYLDSYPLLQHDTALDFQEQANVEAARCNIEATAQEREMKLHKRIADLETRLEHLEEVIGGMQERDSLAFSTALYKIE